MDKKDESCQTGSPERRDCQVQATVQQGQPISIQADIPRESDSIAVQTIKEEIAMPNLASSVAQTPAKKRKMSSSITAFIDLTVSQNPVPGESGVNLNNQEAGVGSTANRLNKKQADLDDEILNSQVYQIYCRNEDKKEAMKQIKELKTCVFFKESTEPFPTEQDFKQACEKCLETLWKMEPRLKDSKFTKVKKYIEVGHFNHALCNFDHGMCKMLNDCFTKIRMIIPNGYECWYVANFEKGPAQSKWYRAESSNETRSENLAELNVMGVTKATIDKFQFLHNLKPTLKAISWFDFAYEVVNCKRHKLFGNNLVNIKLRVVTGSHKIWFNKKVQ